MKIGFDLQLKQEQKLIINQQMKLSIRLLQMSNIDLEKYVQKEVQENPVIEIDYSEFLKHLDSSSYESRGYVNEKEYVSPLNYIEQKKSLKEFLIEQIIELRDKKIKKVCKYIIENIDSRGYLNLSNEKIQDELSISNELVEKSLKVVQALEPLGIGARDLKECLKIQLKMQNVQDQKIFFIIDNYLELIAKNKYGIIAKNLKINIKQAQNYGDIIKKLEPKPSRGFFTGEDTKYIVPEAYIKKINNEYHIIMNSSYVPKLKINKMYKTMINNKEADKGVSEFVKDRLSSAVFLIKSINKRESTIYKILETIVKIQWNYFEYGKTKLKPMTLSDVGEMLQIHQSTVSRAIKNKYIHTYMGTIKIKDLFTNNIKSCKLDEISTNTIKDSIKELIQNEDKNKPLSDNKICELLHKNEVNISRRTVAKYREELKIPSSTKRKRF